MLKLTCQVLFLFLILVALSLSQDYGPQPYNGRRAMGGPEMPLQIFAQCRWFGSGPFCSGECPAGMEATGMSSSCDDHNEHPACAMLYFGSSCWTGHKRLCCPEGFASGCRWFGTAPFCDGECPSGGWMELTRKEDCDNARYWPCSIRDFGDSCSTGTKAYCCPTANMQMPMPINNNDYY